MYRGSSFLLQRDYKVHKPIVEELLKEKYNCLWEIKTSDYIKKETQKTLIQLVEKIKKMYSEIRLSVNIRDTYYKSINGNYGVYSSL